MEEVVVTVNDSNRAPFFEEGLKTTRSMEENSGQGTAAGEPVVATDLNSDTLTYTITSQTGGPYTVDSETGQIRLGTGVNLDFERKSTQEVRLEAKDPEGLTDNIRVVIEIADLNEPPQIQGRQQLEWRENRTGNITRYTATDPERDAFTWSAGGSDGRLFTVDSSGYLSFNDPPDFEMPADANRDNEYLVTVEAQDIDRNTGTLEVTVSVINSTGAEEPTITTTGNPSPYRENGTGAVHTFRARDPQGRPVSWSLTGTDSHVFEISPGGVLTFRSPPDFENPADSNRDNVYEITVVVTDDQGLIDRAPIRVTVANDAESVEPIISTRRPPTTYRENGTSTVYTFGATDPQQQAITWSLEGDDKEPLLSPVIAAAEGC